MGGKVPLAREATVADLADVRSFSRVSSPVYREGGPLRERLRALVAFVRFFPGVHPPVHPQVLGIGEPFAADVADVRFFTGVDTSVLLEMLRAAQAFPAVIAEIEFRRVVTLFVSEKRPFCSEHATAYVAGGAGYFVRFHLRMHAPTVGRELSS